MMRVRSMGGCRLNSVAKMMAAHFILIIVAYEALDSDPFFDRSLSGARISQSTGEPDSARDERSDQTT